MIFIMTCLLCLFMPYFVGGSSIAYIPGIFIILISWKMFHGRRYCELGVNIIFQEIVAGFIRGGLTILFLFALGLISGHVVLLGYRLDLTQLLKGLARFFFVAFYEELFFRGYVLKNCERYLAVGPAIVISAFVFVLAHMLNPSLNFLGTVNIFLVGLFFSFVFLKKGNLSQVVGFHWAWNFFQGDLLGLPVSGLYTAGLLKTRVAESSLWIDAGFGLEGGLFCTLALLLLCLDAVYKNRCTR